MLYLTLPPPPPSPLVLLGHAASLNRDAVEGRCQRERAIHWCVCVTGPWMAACPSCAAAAVNRLIPPPCPCLLRTPGAAVLPDDTNDGHRGGLRHALARVEVLPDRRAGSRLPRLSCGYKESRAEGRNSTPEHCMQRAGHPPGSYGEPCKKRAPPGRSEAGRSAHVHQNRHR